eukprot:CAMPEP_0206464632 /NCGR_PEP_ID=MMETSP0324_2-20121206/27332_1 /ASSEMBLY_ACC=CAM_ASM_000836 /TAXON_ID=2866 /ORGANISM="Crypthecodinium cohnii, Strain Seligo" /LENGTH=512 /DNA_ID=CAMNT_0053937301 /DNA_START=308 /DNA_END=1847 /DNA_ORIENTATION=-
MASESTKIAGAAAEQPEATYIDVLKNKKIAILSYGSRGDAQPFVALGSKLESCGAKVLVMTNVDHIDFVKSFGLEVVATTGSCRDDHKSPEFIEGIATGEFRPFFAKQMQDKEAEMEAVSTKEDEAIENFQPDLLYATPLTYHNACRIMEKKQLPMILGTLFPTTNPFSSLGFRPFRPPVHPTLVHWSPTLTAPLFWQHKSHKVTGFLVMGSQDSSDEAQSDEVFGGKEQRRRLEEFIANGDAPVYMGWGSMVVPPSTAAMAVRALRTAKLRGIILGGWAKLNIEMLDDAEDAEELKEYASKNVFFTSSAPHEWLFPRCAVTVHHGGAGTVAAALRSGVPTVVTPCGLDQPDNAKIVAQNGCGVAMPQFAQLTSEALAKALKECACDEKMRQTCKDMAEKLQKEDGLTAAAEAIAEYAEKVEKEGLPNLHAPEPGPIARAIGNWFKNRWGKGKGKGRGSSDDDEHDEDDDGKDAEVDADDAEQGENKDPNVISSKEGTSQKQKTEENEPQQA